MENSSNKTDKYFRDHLANFEQSPPESSWEIIAGKTGERRKKRVFLLVLKIAAGMAILISSGIGYYFVFTPGIQADHSSLSQKNADTDNSNKIMEKSISGSTDSNIHSKNTASVPPVTPLPGEQIVTTGEYAHNTFTVQQGTAQYTEPFVSRVADAENLPSPELIARIEYPLPYDLPDKLQENHQTLLPPDTLTEEEALALLMADYSDDAEPEKKRDSRWALGSEVAPLYSYRSITSDNMQTDALQEMNNNESGILAYAGGFRIAINTGKRISVQSGIYYSRYGQQKNEVQKIESSFEGSASDYKFIAVNNSTGTISGVVDNKPSKGELLSPDHYYNVMPLDYRAGIVDAGYTAVQGDVEQVKLEQFFDYFEVPLIMKYKVLDRKMDFSLSGGIITNFLVGNAVNMVNDGKTTRIGETTDISKINYQGSFGLGLEYPLVSRFSLTLEPRLRYYINPISNNQTITVHPFSFGFFAGLNYRF